MPKQRPRQSQEQRSVSVTDAYDAFIADREAANVTTSTLAYYRGKLHPFIVWCTENGAPTVAAIASHHPRDYILTLRKRNLSPWTQHGAARAIRAFLRFCVQERIIDAAPKVTFPKLPKELLEPLTLEEVTKLLLVCDYERDRAAVLFLVDTGLRAAEFVALNGGDIDLATGAATVQMGKGQKARVVYFGAKTKRALLRHWREAEKPGRQDPLWANMRTGERLTESGLAQLLRRLGKRAGVEQCTPHMFRRTFALWSLRAGMDIYTLAVLMGHEGIDVLKRYLKLVEQDARAAHKRYGAVDNNL